MTQPLYIMLRSKMCTSQNVYLRNVQVPECGSGFNVTVTKSMYQCTKMVLQDVYQQGYKTYKVTKCPKSKTYIVQ
jgi:hypothetical protein